MAAKLTHDDAPDPGLAQALKSWVMVALTAVFVLLYGAALTGLLRPLADERMVTRLEPIIFVIIGYYFGRLPAQQNERTLKGEIGRQAQKADAAQHAKEQAQQAREALEEKLKNTRATLTSSAPGGALKGSAESLDRSAGLAKDEALRQAVAAAISILNS